MARFIYQEHHIDFLRKTYAKYGVADTARLFNEAFGLSKSEAQIKAALKNHGITCGRKTGELNKGKLRAFTDEQKQWIQTAYKSMSLSEMTQAFNQHFNERKTEKQIRCFTRNHKINSGRTGRFEKGQSSWNKGKKGWKAGGRSGETRFKKGSQPHNTVPVGTEVIDVDGYRKVKVDHPNEWKYVHRLNWERENGPIPDGHIIRFIDDDKMNCDPSNLMLISRAEHAVMNKMNTNDLPPDYRPTMAAVAKLKVKVNERQKRREPGEENAKA